MGTFSVSIEIGDPQGGEFQQMQAIVDTGATFTKAPRHILERLGVPVERYSRFRTADGRLVTRPVGRTIVRAAGQTFPTSVIFGEEQEPALLGALFLEDAMLAADPHNKELIPVDGWEL